MARARRSESSRSWPPTRVKTFSQLWSGPSDSVPSRRRQYSGFSRLDVSPRRLWMRWLTTIGPISTKSWRTTWRHPDLPQIIKPCWARNLSMVERSSPPGKTTPKPPSRIIPAATQRSLHDDVTAALNALGLALAPVTLDAALQAAERECLSHLEFLHRLLAEPAEARRQRALDRRLRDAKFRELTTLEGFDWAFNAKGVDRRAVEQLAT